MSLTAIGTSDIILIPDLEEDGDNDQRGISRSFAISKFY